MSRNSTLPLLALGFLLALPALAKDPVFSAGGFAIRGYDPVAYFEAATPTKGDDAFQHRWMGATWLFASQENRDAFAAEPERFAPRFGGYCAYAVSRGSTASTDPEAWRIVDGRLYLNYSRRIQSKWLKDVPGNIAKAEANWPGVLK